MLLVGKEPGLIVHLVGRGEPIKILNMGEMLSAEKEGRPISLAK
jgi:hypothetical protein